MLLSDVVLKVLRVCCPLVFPTNIICNGLCFTCHVSRLPVGYDHTKQNRMKEQMYESYINKIDKNLNAKCRPAVCLKSCHQNTESHFLAIHKFRKV